MLLLSKMPTLPSPERINLPAGMVLTLLRDEPLKKYPDIASGAKENDRGIKDSVLYDTVRRGILHLAEGKNPF